MFTVLIIVQVIIAISLVGLVLVQQGKGADMGAAFGSGASGTVFGSQGSGSFLTKVTAVMAALFFLNSLMLAVPAISQSYKAEATSVTESIVPVEAPMEELMKKPEPVSDLPAIPEAINDTPVSDLPDVPEGGSVLPQ